jgi:hypothetical protein
MQQKRIMPDRSEKVWSVDINALREKLPNYKWLQNDLLIKRDLKEMADYLPHWVLTVGAPSKPLRSGCCNDNVAPYDGGLRCILCGRSVAEKVTVLSWTGLLPVNLSGRDKAYQKILQARAKGSLNYPIVNPGGKPHLMVPVVVDYPANWPYAPPQGHYADRQLLDTLKFSGGYGTHILSERTMCLYHNAQWNDNTTIMQVIANRIAPHAFALLRLANGETSIEYFVTDYGYYNR